METITAEKYAAELLVEVSCSDEYNPIEFLRLTITPAEAQRILKIMQWHSKNRMDAEAGLQVHGGVFETFANFNVEAFGYADEVCDVIDCEMWGGTSFEAELEPVDLTKLRFDGAHIGLRAIPKHRDVYLHGLCNLVDPIRAIAEGRAPVAARVPA